MTDDEFRTAMVSHMKMQTEFLSAINDALRGFRWVAKTLSAVAAMIMAYFTAADFFGWNHK